MGYTTDFSGSFNVSPALSTKHKDFFTKLATTRRMKRNVGPEYGVEGEFYIEGKGAYGQDRENNIIDYNCPPKTQPSLWCHWIPTEDGTAFEWDGGEKFYNYIEWLEYIVTFLAPLGYVVNGEVEWQGEDSDDRGLIIVKNNKVKTKIGRIVYS